MPDKSSKITFPKRFLWGASLSAHQAEGGNYNQWSVWEQENARARAAQAEYHYGDLPNWDTVKEAAKSPDNYISSKAADHYKRYQEDFDLAKKLQLNALRFSVEWSRIEPEEGVWDAAAIAHYRTYLKELKRRDIEPMMTLLHFTLPVWFAEKGGFSKRSNVKYFVRFAEKIVRELGPDVRYIITINEPTVYAFLSYTEGTWPPNDSRRRKSYWVLHNQIVAHKQVAKKIHALNRRYKVSIAMHATYVYPGDDALLSRFWAGLIQFFKDDYTLRQVKKSCDFLGVNYYFSDRIYGYRTHNPNDRLSDLGWDMQPANLEYVLERLHRKYKLPIIVTENGLADAADVSRQWWLTQSLLAMQRALDEGVKLDGYFHWSLTDNFEWAEGKWPRFGLIEVDYQTQQRTVRPSALWFAKVIKRLR